MKLLHRLERTPGPVLIDNPAHRAQTLRFTAITEKPAISSYRPTYKGNVPSESVRLPP